MKAKILLLFFCIAVLSGCISHKERDKRARVKVNYTSYSLQVDLEKLPNGDLLLPMQFFSQNHVFDDVGYLQHFGAKANRLELIEKPFDILVIDKNTCKRYQPKFTVIDEGNNMFRIRFKNYKNINDYMKITFYPPKLPTNIPVQRGGRRNSTYIVSTSDFSEGIFRKKGRYSGLRNKIRDGDTTILSNVIKYFNSSNWCVTDQDAINKLL